VANATTTDRASISYLDTAVSLQYRRIYAISSRPC